MEEDLLQDLEAFFVYTEADGSQRASEARTVPLISLGVREGLFFCRFFLTFFFFRFASLCPQPCFALTPMRVPRTSLQVIHLTLSLYIWNRERVHFPLRVYLVLLIR